METTTTNAKANSAASLQDTRRQDAKSDVACPGGAARGPPILDVAPINQKRTEGAAGESHTMPYRSRRTANDSDTSLNSENPRRRRRRRLVAFSDEDPARNETSNTSRCRTYGEKHQNILHDDGRGKVAPRPNVRQSPPRELHSATSSADGMTTAVIAAVVDATQSGGVAIYKSINTSSQACAVNIFRTAVDTRVGQICFAEITLNSQTIFHLGCVYIHPNVSLGHIKQFLFSQLFQYSSASASIDEDFPIDADRALLIVGDFNTDVTQQAGLLNFMKSKFNLDYTPNDSPTTIGGINIDLVFTRNIPISLCNFISHLSYHRPICKIAN